MTDFQKRFANKITHMPKQGIRHLKNEPSKAANGATNFRKKNAGYSTKIKQKSKFIQNSKSEILVFILTPRQPSKRTQHSPNGAAPQRKRLPRSQPRTAERPLRGRQPLHRVPERRI